VSVATASRVATGNAAVRAQTRARVERAMRELLYAAPPRVGGAGAVGLLVPDLANPIFPMLAQAMESAATELGYASILCSTAASAEQEGAYVQMLLAHRVEGMVFVSCEATDLRGDHSHYARLHAQGARMMFVNGAVTSLDVPSVGVDERAAGELATSHLIELGHKRIGFVAGPPHARPTVEKASGRRLALQAAGLADIELTAHGEWGVEGGAAAMRELLARGARRRPTAVICSSDVMAIGALLEAKAAGVRVPEDLSIVGFDGIDATRWTDPPLTTLAQPTADIAGAAVAALHALITNTDGAHGHWVFRPELIARASSGPPR
jgi:DNA-binding LacI/PurR family transcriptional regulator